MDTIAPLWLWGAFALIVIVSLFVDFVVLRRQGAHEVQVGEALRWTLVWVALSLAFNGLLWWAVQREHGSAAADAKALAFLTGYLIEKSLAVDNIFVFLLIFTHMAVPAAQQKRVLMIGIVGAIVLRTVMILVGAWMVQQMHWLLLVFGAFLVITGIKMWRSAGEPADLSDNAVLRQLRRWMPVTDTMHGDKLWIVQAGRRVATPLLLVVVLVGVTDVIFAVDSIPAIFAITTDPFIVLTSNILAILGLRAMYFLLAAMAERFHLLSHALAVILVFIGCKMLLVDVMPIPVWVSLTVVASVLALALLASVCLPSRVPRPAAGALPTTPDQ